MSHLLSVMNAIFIATGASAARRLDIPGNDLPGVVDALTYLAAPERSHGPSRNEHVVVLGGGDTAIDCARTAIRRGAASVTVAYRGPQERMRALPTEVQAALNEGIVFRYSAVPVAFTGQLELDAVVFADGERLRCHLAIEAIGQTFNPPVGLSEFGLRVDDAGRIIADGHGGTAHPRIFAGGDNTLGPGLVVTAAAAGRRAANAILGAPEQSRSAVEHELLR